LNSLGNSLEVYTESGKILPYLFGMNFIIHPDEIFLKGTNQPFFYRALKNNLEKLFAGANVRRVESGMVLSADLNEQDINRLALIPGIANFAPAIITKADNINDLKKSIDKLLQTPECANSKHTSFRISSERSYKSSPLSSKQIANEIGEYVRLKTGWKVDLKHQDLDINIAIGKDQAIIYGNLTDGAGGLPTESSGKVLCLLSGGIDSPVAAYKLMCRGAEVGLIHFQNQTQVTVEVGEKIFDLAKTLANYQSEVQLFMVPFAELQKQVIMKIPSQYRMLITRRLFNKIACEIAKANKYQALANGNSLGQVASQTLENISVVEASSDLLTLSPLIGTNKKDIMNTAKKIGTLEISNRPYEDCCSLFVAKHPETKARRKQIEEMEKAVDMSQFDKSSIISYYISASSARP